MGETEMAKVCPYCGGKGHVSVDVDLPRVDGRCEELGKTTWVRKPCPLCDGKGRISGDDSTLTNALLASFQPISCRFVPPGPKQGFKLIYRLQQ